MAAKKKSKLDKLADKNANNGHARLSPSAADRWTECTASVPLYDEVQPRETSSIHADRGTRLHEVSEKILRKDDPKYTKKTLAALPVDEREAIQPYIEYVQSRPGTKVYEAELIFIDDNVFGTGDCVILDFENSEIEVVDLKCGAGVPVAASHNKQLICYGLGALRKYGDLHDWKSVRMTISQAAAGNPVDPWRQVHAEMLRWAAYIRDTCTSIDNGDVVFSATEKACKWCKVKLHCPEIKRGAQQAAHADFGNLTAEMVNPDTGYIMELDWPDLIELAEVLDLFVKEVRSQSKDMILDGKGIEGFKVVEGKRSRAFIGEDRARRYLKCLGVPTSAMHTQPKFMSPNQIEGVLKERGMNPTKIAHIIRTFPGSPTVARADDKRPPIDRQNQARKDFEGVTD